MTRQTAPKHRRKTRKKHKTKKKHSKNPLQDPHTLEKWRQRTITAINHYHQQQPQHTKPKQHHKQHQTTQQNKPKTQNFKYE
jgi:hypothetical protein